MSRIKQFIMDVSNEMGFNGEINDEVLEEATSRLSVSVSEKRRLKRQLSRMKDVGPTWPNGASAPEED